MDTSSSSSSTVSFAWELGEKVRQFAEMECHCGLN